MRQRIKLEGFKELAAALRKLPDAVRSRVIVRALRAGAAPVEAEAKRLAPVLKKADPRRKAGTLKDAIRTSKMRDKNLDGAAVKVHVKRLAGKVVSAFKSKTGKASTENPDDPFYANFVEFGTSKAAAQPFLRPALHAQRHTALGLLREEIRKGVEREARRQAKHNRLKG